MMPATQETTARPLYSGEFKPLDMGRLMPRTTRYQPRTEPAIGMFDTAKQPRGTKPQPTYVIGQAELIRAQAARRHGANRTIRPHSIATRCIEAMRARGDWIATAELVDLANRHQPEHCVTATRRNIYEALAEYRKRDIIESRHIAVGSQVLEWRIKP
jgi:hypothetical protein